MEAITREEKIMSGENLTPITREEMFLAKAAGQDVKTPEPITRKEKFLSKISGGGGAVSSCKLPQVIDGTVTEITAEDLQGVTSIRDYAFYRNENLKMLELPNTILKIGNFAWGNTLLEKLNFLGEVWQWCSIPNGSTNSYSICKNLHIKGERLEHIDITPTPETLKGTYKAFGIQLFAFNNCNSLKSVKLRDASKRYDIGDKAFTNCTNLTRVEIGSAILNNLTSNTHVGLATNPSKSLASNLFYGCTNLTDIYVCWSEGYIKNAPWGATNATIHYDTPIQFYIGEKEYFAQLNMTFEEWCNSEFNTDGFYIDENDSNYVKNADGLYVKRFNSYNFKQKLDKTTGVRFYYEYLLEE